MTIYGHVSQSWKVGCCCAAGIGRWPISRGGAPSRKVAPHTTLTKNVASAAQARGPCIMLELAACDARSACGEPGAAAAALSGDRCGWLRRDRGIEQISTARYRLDQAVIVI